MAVDTRLGFTSKLMIGEHDLYLKTGWEKGRMVHIDMTLSRGAQVNTCDEAFERLQGEKYFLARAWVEDSCRMASKLFDKGVEAEEIVGMWMGVEGYPNGYCAQTGSLVKGPLHAAAAYIRQNHDRWKAMMEGV